MKNLKLTLLILTFFMSIGLHAQNRVSGQVISANENEPVIGVTVIIKGTQKGTVSDVDGNFSINALPTDTLIFSFIGYTDVLEVVGDKKVVNAIMIPSMEDLAEIVVIGYGTIRKSDLTGSVASVSSDDYNPGPITSVSNLLQSTAPGVVLKQNSAQPGGSFDVRVRGTSSKLNSNEPLYVIDGMPMATTSASKDAVSRYISSPDKNPLNGINPDDIVSIEILKDASAAAIYGARAANGVVLITTKQGKDDRSVVNYSYSISSQEITKEYDMLNAEDYSREANEYAIFNGQSPLFTPAEVNTAGEGTNWMNEITRKGLIQKHQLSFSGGNGKTNYYASGNYYNHQGIVKNTNMDRYSGRLNLNSKISDKLSMGVNLSMSFTADDQVHFGRTGGGEDEFAGLFDNTRTWSPTVSVFQDDGRFSVHPFISMIPNPVSLLEMDNQFKTTRNIGTIFGEYEIISGLKAKLNIGFDREDENHAYYIPTSVYRGAQVNGEGALMNNVISSLLGEITLNYHKEYKSSNLDVLGGYTYQHFKDEGFGTKATNFASERTNIYDLSGASSVEPSFSHKEESKLLSYLGRVHYGINDKYLITVTGRADGSTRFGTNNKWGFFPSGALAWKISNEDFFTVRAINELKARVSYGFTGNQEFANKQSLRSYGTTNPFILGNPGAINVGLKPTRAGDPNLKWETTSQFNIGVDFAILDSRIQGTIDYYNKITKDVILPFDLPGTAGFSTITTNAGEIQNSGFEFSIRTNNLSGEIKWTTNFNIAYNKNRWKDRSGYFPYEYEEEFGPVGGTYGFIIDGVFQLNDDIASSAQPAAEPGMYKFKDLNGRDGNGELTGQPDGRIDGDDRVLLGYWQPDYTLGLNNLFSYKFIDFSFFFQGMIGNDKENYTRAELENPDGLQRYRNKSVAILDRWTEDNPSNTLASGAINPYGHTSLNSMYIEDASFLRLRNVTIGFTLPDIKVGGKELFDDLRVYFDAQNVLLFTGYKGLDPETDENNQYPNAKTYTAGINVTF